MEKKNYDLLVKVIWDSILMGCPYDLIAEAQGVSVSVVKYLSQFLGLYNEYREAARKQEYEKIRGYNEKIASLWGLIPSCV